MCTHSCILVCLYMCLCAFSHVFFYFFFFSGGGWFLFSQKAKDMKVCRCTDREETERVERGVERSQEELSSSNRQRAKRMTVPSSSLSVNMIMFEPSLRSKACHTACKEATKGSRMHGKAVAGPSYLCINSVKIQQNEIMKITYSPGTQAGNWSL